MNAREFPLFQKHSVLVEGKFANDLVEAKSFLDRTLIANLTVIYILRAVGGSLGSMAKHPRLRFTNITKL
jgi:hypothetical protein